MYYICVYTYVNELNQVGHLADNVSHKTQLVLIQKQSKTVLSIGNLRLSVWL